MTGVVFDRLRLPAPGIARHGQHQRVLLGIGEQLVHPVVTLGLDDDPLPGVVADLRSDIAPHFLGDKLPVTVKHLRKRRRAYAP